MIKNKHNLNKISLKQNYQLIICHINPKSCHTDSTLRKGQDYKNSHLASILQQQQKRGEGY